MRCGHSSTKKNSKDNFFPYTPIFVTWIVLFSYHFEWKEKKGLIEIV